MSERRTVISEAAKKEARVMAENRVTCAKLSEIQEMGQETPKLADRHMEYQSKAKDVLGTAFLPKLYMETLKPCPFCDGKAMIEDWLCGYEKGTTIQCKRCGACISENVESCPCGDWHSMAIKKWNARIATSQKAR